MEYIEDDGIHRIVHKPLRPEERLRYCRPPVTPVLLRHPPTYEEWLDSLPSVQESPDVEE